MAVSSRQRTSNYALVKSATFGRCTSESVVSRVRRSSDTSMLGFAFGSTQPAPRNAMHRCIRDRGFGHGAERQAGEAALHPADHGAVSQHEHAAFAVAAGRIE